MDDEVPRSAEAAGEALPEPALPPSPQGPLADAVATEADQLRDLIDAGAGSPEELRALAARIREHRALEESRWRSDVRPSLLKSKKRRFSLGDLSDRPEQSNSTNSLGLGLALLAGVLVLLLAATQSSFLWILVPVAAVLVYAYRQGKRAESEPATVADPPSDDPPA